MKLPEVFFPYGMLINFVSVVVTNFGVALKLVAFGFDLSDDFVGDQCGEVRWFSEPVGLRLQLVGPDSYAQRPVRGEVRLMVDPTVRDCGS